MKQFAGVTADAQTVNGHASDVLAANSDVFGSFLEGASVCMVRLDTEGQVVAANHEFFLLAGPPAEICRQSFFDLVQMDAGSDKLREQFAELVHGQHGKFVNRAAVLVACGRRVTASLAGVAVYDTAGVVETVVVMLAPERVVSDGDFVARGKRMLTEMDCRILEGVAAGVPTAGLAELVDLSRGGVEYHVTSLLRKLKVTNRTSLVSKAYAHGIFAAGVWPPKVVSDSSIEHVSAGLRGQDSGDTGHR